MIVRSVLLLFLAAMLCSCASPVTESLLNSAKDARVFNPATGRYEWPDE